MPEEILNWTNKAPTDPLLAGQSFLMNNKPGNVVNYNAFVDYVRGFERYFKIVSEAGSSIPLTAGVDTILPLPIKTNNVFTISGNTLTFHKIGVVRGILTINLVGSGADSQFNLCTTNSGGTNYPSSRRGFEVNSTSKTLTYSFISQVSLNDTLKIKMNSASAINIEFLPAIGTFGTQPPFILELEFIERTSLSTTSIAVNDAKKDKVSNKGHFKPFENKGV